MCRAVSTTEINVTYTGTVVTPGYKFLPTSVYTEFLTYTGQTKLVNSRDLWTKTDQEPVLEQIEGRE